MARSGNRPRRLAAWFLLTLLPVFCVAGVAGAMDAKEMPRWQKLHQRLAAEREVREYLAKKTLAHEAINHYDAEVAPRLVALSPTALNVTKIEGVHVNLSPAEKEATGLLRDANRTPAQSAAVRMKLEAEKKTADEIAERTTGEPTVVEAFNRRRARVHRFAVARAESFALLLAMLDAGAPPTREAWSVWQAARLEADRLWDEAKAK